MTLILMILLAAPPALGAAAPFVLLSGDEVEVDAPAVVHGRVGAAGNLISDVLPLDSTHDVAAALADAQAARDALGVGCDGATVVGPELGGQALDAGVYCVPGDATLTGRLDTSGEVVVRIAGGLTVADGAEVAGCSVTWVVDGPVQAGAATLRGTVFAGSWAALYGTRLEGRVVAPIGWVVVTGGSASPTSCGAPPLTSSSVVTVGGWIYDVACEGVAR